MGVSRSLYHSWVQDVVGVFWASRWLPRSNVTSTPQWTRWRDFIETSRTLSTFPLSFWGITHNIIIRIQKPVTYILLLTAVKLYCCDVQSCFYQKSETITNYWLQEMRWRCKNLGFPLCSYILGSNEASLTNIKSLGDSVVNYPGIYTWIYIHSISGRSKL